jgi:hypothetical protein
MTELLLDPGFRSDMIGVLIVVCIFGLVFALMWMAWKS